MRLETKPFQSVWDFWPYGKASQGQSVEGGGQPNFNWSGYWRSREFLMWLLSAPQTCSPWRLPDSAA